jgi:hypothetical protein
MSNLQEVGNFTKQFPTAAGSSIPVFDFAHPIVAPTTQKAVDASAAAKKVPDRENEHRSKRPPQLGCLTRRRRKLSASDAYRSANPDRSFSRGNRAGISMRIAAFDRAPRIAIPCATVDDPHGCRSFAGPMCRPNRAAGPASSRLHRQRRGGYRGREPRQPFSGHADTRVVQCCG